MAETTIAPEGHANATELAPRAAQTRIHGEPANLPEAHPPQLLLPRNLAAIAKCCAKESPRFGQTTGVQLTRNADGGYTAVSTDGRTLACVTGPADAVDDYPPIPALASAPNGATTASIHARDWQAAFKALPKRCGYKPILERVAVVMSEQCTTLVSTDLERVNAQTPRNVEGRFPQWERAIPQRKPVATIDVDPALLINVLETASAFTDGETKRVTMEIRDPATPIVVRNHGQDGQRFIGLVVPLVCEKKTPKGPQPVKECGYDFWRHLERVAKVARSNFKHHDTAALEDRMQELRGLLVQISE